MRFLVTIFVYAFLLDALLSAASEWLPISPVRNTVALLVLSLGLLLYTLSAFITQVPRRIVIPATLLLVWGNVCGGFPISFLMPEHAQTIMAWVQLPCAILLLGIHWHWRRSPPALPLPGFPWRRFAVVALLTIALAPLALTTGLVNALGTFMEDGTDGYLKLRPAGLLLEEREFAKDEKRVRLVSMMHIGRRGFYEQIHSSLPANDGAIVLLEGISDKEGLLTERFTYVNFAKMLGLTSQESSALQQGKPEPEATPTAITNLEPRVRYRHADLDISLFDPVTIEFINTIGALLAKPSFQSFLQTANDPESPLNREGADEIVMDDILYKRNEHLVAEIDDALKTSRVVIVPWGALHLPDIEFALKERGFTEIRRIERQVVAFRPETNSSR
jgi:hypothetical protein